MASPAHFAVLQKELVSPSADQLKRAFKSFSNLTDADAVRLAVTARGILMRGLGHDAARALQSALLTERINAVVVPEAELPRLPEIRSLQRASFAPDGLVTFDLLERPTAIPWENIALVSAAAVGHFEVNTFQTERTALSFSLIGGFGSKKIQEKAHKVESGCLLLLQVLLADYKTLFEIEAARFMFKPLIDQPDWATEEKFVWTVREISRRATAAVLNHGAREVLDGAEGIAGYASRQSLADETVWLMWHRSTETAAGSV